jgi:uncharacterized protein YqfB (UPF0267 family)
VDVFNGNETSIDLSILNTDNVSRTFSVNVFPSIWNNVLVSPEHNLIRVDSGETESMKIFFTALFEANQATSEFVITVADSADSSIQSNQTIRLRVLYRSPVYVSNIKTDALSYNPSDEVSVQTDIRNDGAITSGEYALQTVVSIDGNNLQVFDDFIDPLSARTGKTLTNEFTLDKYQKAGDYKIDSVLRNNLGFVVSKRTATFKVNEFAGTPSKESKTDFGFLSATTILTGRHEGNVPKQITLTVLVPSFAKDLFISETQYTEVEEGTGVTAYKYVSPTIEPGQTYTVRYQFSIWQVWATAIIIAAIVWLAFRYVFTPTIVKTYRRGPLTKDNEILVTLEVKNRSMSTIRDIVVKDFVPNIAKVVTRFETIKPSAREAREGTELTWHFDSLHAQEERIVTYRIRPVMDIVGTLRLPTATMHYATKNKVKRDTVSRELIERPRRK